jgi:hypothetical protein
LIRDEITPPEELATPEKAPLLVELILPEFVREEIVPPLFWIASVTELNTEPVMLKDVTLPVLVTSTAAATPEPTIEVTVPPILIVPVGALICRLVQLAESGLVLSLQVV